MVWCPLGNREISLSGGDPTDDPGVVEFSIGGLCSGCENDFGLGSHHRNSGLPVHILESELMGEDRLTGDYIMAVLVNANEEEVVKCEIDEVL